MKFTVIGKQGCVYCTKARDLLFDTDFEWQYRNIDNRPEVAELLKDIGFSTVPVIFMNIVGSKHPQLIGGYEDLKAYLEE